MKRYFYTDGTTNFGPFTIDELRQKGITGDTSVKYEEGVEWVKAGTVPDLQELFSADASVGRPQIIYPNPSRGFLGSTSLIELFVFLSILLWFLIHLTNLFIFRIFHWSGNFVDGIQFSFSFIFNAVPILFALIIKKKSLKITALVFAGLIYIFNTIRDVIALVEKLS